MSIDADLKELAANIVTRAKQEATTLTEKIDAMKVLTTYWGLVLRKRDKRMADDDGDGDTIGELRDRMLNLEEDEENGTAHKHS